MKKYSIILFILYATFSCTNEKSVDLSAINMLTGGKSKEWKFVEWMDGNTNRLDDDCFKDDTALFSKGDPESKSDTLQRSSYTWKKNELKCGLTDKDLIFKITLLDDEKTLYIENEKWIIENITNSKLILISNAGTNPQRVTYEALDKNKKITPELGNK